MSFTTLICFHSFTLSDVVKHLRYKKGDVQWKDRIAHANCWDSPSSCRLVLRDMSAPWLQWALLVLDPGFAFTKGIYISPLVMRLAPLILADYLISTSLQSLGCPNSTVWKDKPVSRHGKDTTRFSGAQTPGNERLSRHWNTRSRISSKAWWKSTKPNCRATATRNRIWCYGGLSCNSWHQEGWQGCWLHPCMGKGGERKLEAVFFDFSRVTTFCLSNIGMNASKLEIISWLARWQAAGLLAGVQVCSPGKTPVLYYSKAEYVKWNRVMGWSGVGVVVTVLLWVYLHSGGVAKEDCQEGLRIQKRGVGTSCYASSFPRE